MYSEINADFLSNIPEWKTRGCVYILRHTQDHTQYKIGYTKQLERRLARIGDDMAGYGMGNVEPDIIALAFTSRYIDLEKHLHQKFRSWRREKEMFSVVPEAAIREMKNCRQAFKASVYTNTKALDRPQTFSPSSGEASFPVTQPESASCNSADKSWDEKLEDSGGLAMLVILTLIIMLFFAIAGIP